MTFTVIGLLDTLRTHLTEFDLPAPCSAQLTTSPSGPQMSLQIDRHDAHDTACAVVAWADTLTQPTAEAWRVPSSNSVHLSITGHLLDGVCLRIYGAVPVIEHGLGADLAPDAAITIPLATLRHLATEGEVPA